MLLLERLLHPNKKLSEGQKAVARWLVTHRGEIAVATVKTIAEATYTSPATVVRLSKNMGYSGFEPMRQVLVGEIVYLDAHFNRLDPNNPFSPDDSVMMVANKIAMLARETIVDTLSLMDDESLENAVDLIDGARKLYVGAQSFPLIYAQDFQLKMRRIGKDVEVVTLAGEQTLVANLVHADDCGLVISYSGSTPMTVELARLYKSLGIPVIALTGMGQNDLREIANVTLTLTTREMLYPDATGFTSHLSIKQVLDTLFACAYVRKMQ